MLVNRMWKHDSQVYQNIDTRHVFEHVEKYSLREVYVQFMVSGAVRVELEFSNFDICDCLFDDGQHGLQWAHDLAINNGLRALDVPSRRKNRVIYF